MVSVALMAMRFAPIVTMHLAIVALSLGVVSASAQYSSPDAAPYPTATDTPAAKPTVKPTTKRVAKATAIKPAVTAAIKPALPSRTKSDAAKSTAKAEPSRDLFVGIPRGERLKLQAALLWSGDYTGAVNGDPMLTAIKNFQKRIKAKVTGELTSAERSTLLAAAHDHEQEFGWSVVVDPATGIRIGLPTKMVPQAREAAHGTRWSSRHGEIQVETFRFADPDLKLSALFEKEKKEPAARRVEYSVLHDDNFFVSGLQGLKKFSVRAQMHNGEIRGFTMLFDQAMEGIVAPVMVAMASAFSPFPQHSAPFAALAKPVEYGNGLVVSRQGHIVTDARLTNNCQVLVVVGLGDADRIAEDNDKGLALLRVYGPRKFAPLSFAEDAAKAGQKPIDITLVGIPDPKEQDGSGKLTEIKARLADGNAIELHQPIPMAGFSGAAALDGQGLFLGMAEMRNAVLASTAPAAPPVRLVKPETIQSFLDAHHVLLTPARSGNARDSIARIICVRK